MFVNYTCDKKPRGTIVTLRPSGAIISTRHPIREGIHVVNGAFHAFKGPILCTGDAGSLVFGRGRMRYASSSSFHRGPLFVLGNYGNIMVERGGLRRIYSGGVRFERVGGGCVGISFWPRGVGAVAVGGLCSFFVDALLISSTIYTKKASCAGKLTV